MLRDNLKRREGLLQSATNREISEHSHAYYDYKDIVFFAGYPEIVTSLTEKQVGQTIPIEPLYFMEAVKAKLYLTAKFGGTDSFTLSLYCNGLVYTTTETKSLLSYSLISYDITDELKKLFKNSEEYNSYITMKVSNAATGVAIDGVTLRIYSTGKNDFGAYDNKVKQYLGQTSLVEKQYLVSQSLKDEKFNYISELNDQFVSR